jgi:predicted transcriptional regulator
MPERVKPEPIDKPYLVDMRRRLAYNMHEIMGLRDVDIAFILGINRSSVSRILKANKPSDQLVKVIKKIRK